MQQGGRFSPKFTWLLAIMAVAIIGGVLLAARSETMQALLGRWSFVRAITQDHSTYYRLKVKLAYKGESQDFDIVVGCNVRQINYKDGGRTYEAGLVPTVFGRRMSDGKALVVRPPNACRGETTANGHAQPDLLPVVVVYDNADRLDFGTAYLSEDAYENPLSVLKFGGATIEMSTRRAFDDFRRTQTNLISRAKYFSGSGVEAIKKMGLEVVSPPFAYMCETYARYRIPADIRPLVQGSWPEGRPKYWLVDSYDAEGRIGWALRHSKNLETDLNATPHSFLDYGNPGDGAADRGFPTRTSGGRLYAQRVGFPESYYPAAPDYRSDQWPADLEEWPRFIRAHREFADINVAYRNGQTRGFAYCSTRTREEPDRESLEMEKAKRIVGRVDDEQIVSKRRTWGAAVQPVLIFERDEYAWFLNQVFLGSPGGDV